MMADYERATPISYKWSIGTFCVSNTVFEIIRCLVYNGISPSRPKFWGFFGPHNPKFQNLQTGPLKGTSLRQNTHFELLCVRIRQSVRPVRVLMKQKKNKKKIGNFLDVNVTPLGGYLPLVGSLPNLAHILIPGT